MAIVVPPKSKPFNFTSPLIGKDGKATPEWQQTFTAIQQRLDGPVSTATAAVPATSASPGFPGQIIADTNFVYVYVAGVWRRAALAAF